MDNRKIIPKQKTGKQMDCYETAEFSTATEAVQFYATATQRLMDINHWNDIADIPSASFCLFDENSNKVERPVQVGDYVRIDIPGPGLPSSDGFDWVCVERIEEEVLDQGKRTFLTLRPSSDPTNTHPDTAHFFKALATSTLLVEQHHHAVSVQYAGRNELINTDNTHMLDNIRNFMVGLGAKLGASFPQWKALVTGIIKH